MTGRNSGTMDTEYDPYPKHKNEDRVSWGAWLKEIWSNNGGCILIILFFVFIVSGLGWIIYDSNNKASHQSLYTDNATDITATCMQQTAYAGELLDCLYAKGFTLAYRERPVTRIGE
jgi:hypothetical protein